MLWVYSDDKYLFSYSAEIDIKRYNLTFLDVRLLRLKHLLTKVDPRTERVKA